jgi:hypothetical protein
MIKVSLMVTLIFLSSCSSRPQIQGTDSDYVPAVNPALVPQAPIEGNMPNNEPGSTNSPQMQTLPKAKP